MNTGDAFVPVRSLASQSIDSVHLKVVNPIPRITVHIYAMINLPPLIISYVHVFCNSTIAWRTRGTRSVHGIGQNCEFDSWELYFEGRLFVRDDDYRLFQVDGKGFSSSSSLNVFGRIKRNCRGDEIYICIKKEEDKGRCEIWMAVRKSVGRVQFPLNGCAPRFLSRGWSGQKILRNRILCPQIAEMGACKSILPSLLFTKPTSLLCNLCSIHFSLSLPIFPL